MKVDHSSNVIICDIQEKNMPLCRGNVELCEMLICAEKSRKMKPCGLCDRVATQPILAFLRNETTLYYRGLRTFSHAGSIHLSHKWVRPVQFQLKCNV